MESLNVSAAAAIALYELRGREELRPGAAADAHPRRPPAPGRWPLPAAIAPRSPTGYAVQAAAVAEALGAVPGRLQDRRHAKRMQDYLGLAGPAGGFMVRGCMPAAQLRIGAIPRPRRRMRDRRCGSGTTCRRALRRGPGGRGGGRDLAGDRDRGEPLRPPRPATWRWHPHADRRPGLSRRRRAGPPAADWRAMDLGGSPGRIRIDGKGRATGPGRDLLGHPLEALAWLAASGRRQGFGGLRAGQVVMARLASRRRSGWRARARSRRISICWARRTLRFVWPDQRNCC